MDDKKELPMTLIQSELAEAKLNTTENLMTAEDESAHAVQVYARSVELLTAAVKHMRGILDEFKDAPEHYQDALKLYEGFSDSLVEAKLKLAITRMNVFTGDKMRTADYFLAKTEPSALAQ